MKEGKGQIFNFKDKNLKLDDIIESLLNNDEFLSKITEQVLVKFVEKKENCEKNQEFDSIDLKNTEQEQFWNKEVSASCCEEDSLNEDLEKYRDEISEKESIIENLKEQIKNLHKELDTLNNEKAQEILRLQNEKKRVEYNLEELKQKNKSLKQDMNTLERKYYEIEASISQKLDIKDREIQEKNSVISYQELKINTLESQFSPIKESYNLFLNLNDEIKNDIISILRGDKIENFVYAGVQYKNIESIWDYAKNRAINGQFEDLDKLQKIIMNFLDAYNITYTSPLYEVQSVENGDDFDEERFIRGHESKITGDISNVDLKGYINLRNGKIIKKSVVRI